MVGDRGEAGQVRITDDLKPSGLNWIISLRAPHGDDAHSFPTMLSDLVTLTKKTVRVGENVEFDQISRPTKLQQTALDLLGVEPRLWPGACRQPEREKLDVTRKSIVPYRHGEIRSKAPTTLGGGTLPSTTPVPPTTGTPITSSQNPKRSPAHRRRKTLTSPSPKPAISIATDHSHLF